MKNVGGFENWSAYLSGLQLVALDYSGVSSAAGCIFDFWDGGVISGVWRKEAGSVEGHTKLATL